MPRHQLPARLQGRTGGQGAEGAHVQEPPAGHRTGVLSEDEEQRWEDIRVQVRPGVPGMGKVPDFHRGVADVGEAGQVARVHPHGGHLLVPVHLQDLHQVRARVRQEDQGRGLRGPGDGGEVWRVEPGTRVLLLGVFGVERFEALVFF